jgi:hypothetical protein
MKPAFPAIMVFAALAALCASIPLPAQGLIVELSSNETNMSSGQHGIMWIRLTNNDIITVNATVILPDPTTLKAYEMSFVEKENGGRIISKTLAKGESSRTILIRVMSYSEGTEDAIITIEKFIPPSTTPELIKKTIKFSSVTPVSFDELSPLSMAVLLAAAAIIFYIFSARPARRE